MPQSSRLLRRLRRIVALTALVAALGVLREYISLKRYGAATTA